MQISLHRGLFLNPARIRSSRELTIKEITKFPLLTNLQSFTTWQQIHFAFYQYAIFNLIQALLRENLSLRFPTRPCSNQPAQIHVRLANLEIFTSGKMNHHTCQRAKDKAADKPAQLRRLISSFAVRTQEIKFFHAAMRPIYTW